MPRVLVFGALGALVTVAACNAISGLDEDFTLAPFDGGPTDGNDGSTTPDDATSDPDGTSNVDGGGDAPSSDAFSCDAGNLANVVFCTDFETDASWTNDEIVSGAVTFDLDAGPGGSRAMHAHVDSANVSRRAALWKRISGNDAETFKHYDVAFDFMVASKGFPYAALGVFALTQPAGGNGLRYYGPASFPDETLDVVDDQPRIVPGGTTVDGMYGTWHHAYTTLDREGTGTTYHATLKIDATVVDDRAGFDFVDPQTAELRIGILFTSTNAGTMDLYIDNVMVRREQ